MAKLQTGPNNVRQGGCERVRECNTLMTQALFVEIKKCLEICEKANEKFKWRR